MNKYLITFSVMILLLSSTVFCQSIKKLEYDLSWHYSIENYGDKIDKARKLQEIDPFNYQATDYICRYYYDRNIDSVSIYFDNMIEKHPHNSEPYLLRTMLLHYENDYRDRETYNKQKVKYLNHALQIDNSSLFTIFKLAETYYNDFIFPLEKEKDWGFTFENYDDFIDTTLMQVDKKIERSTFEYSADSALKYLYLLWSSNTEQRDIIYYPIRQLECYLNRHENSIIPKNADKNFNQCFFPSWYFANLSEDWQCDNTINYLFEIEMAKNISKWIEIQLINLKEKCLFNKELEEDVTIYRFTWLRSFSHPIAIRIENSEKRVMLYWKIGKSLGGYDPKGLKKSGKKKLNKNEWEAFIDLVVKSDFDNLPNEKGFPVIDGATWTLEKRTHDKFKAHHTNWPNSKFEDTCLFLLDLAKLR